MTVNKAFLLKRGWTRTAIKRFLGEPDGRIPMVRFRKDRPECRYSMDRVLVVEDSGIIRFRQPGDRCMPGPEVPHDTAEAMVSAGSARARRKILRQWAEREGMISADDPARQKRLQWDNVVRLFCPPKSI